MSSSVTTMGMSDDPFEVVAHMRAFREYAGQHKGEEHGEPAVDRKAGIEIDGVRRRRNGLADRADDDAEHLQREQRPGDRAQALGIGGDEWVAGGHGFDHREEPLEDAVVERNRNEA